MSALDTLLQIVETDLINYNLKYCLVDTNKKPIKYDGSVCRPNNTSDFVDLTTLVESDVLDNYAGIGISIQASNIAAIDVDKCFKIPFDETTADDRATIFIERFKNLAYIEFSFSGTGLRILFDNVKNIKDYESKYYIKNSAKQIEFYQPSMKARYVTVTGKWISKKSKTAEKYSPLDIDTTLSITLEQFMKRPQSNYERTIIVNESKSIDELFIIVKKCYYKDMNFQNLWFTNAPGSGKDESERDYHLVAYLYENVTQNEDMIKQLFEMSPFFKTKDFKHQRKWSNDNFRYFHYLYDRIRRK